MINLPQRKSPRLQGYDYSQSGAYFVTICTSKRQHLFGEIQNEIMKLNAVGELTETCWAEIPQHYPQIELGAYVVMPNHVHGILILNDLAEGPKFSQTTLGQVISGFKSSVTRIAAKQNLIESGYSLWQTRYHDHIIRNEASYNYIYQYVVTNPSRWEKDELFTVQM